MSQEYIYPVSNAPNVTILAEGATGAPAPAFALEVAGVDNAGNLEPISVDSSGNQNVNVINSTLPTGGATAANQVLEIADLDALNARTAGSLVPLAYDEIDLTYVPSGNGAGQVATAVYKLATVTQATLTMTYDGSNRLSSVVKS